LRQPDAGSEMSSIHDLGGRPDLTRGGRKPGGKQGTMQAPAPRESDSMDCYAEAQGVPAGPKGSGRKKEDPKEMEGRSRGWTELCQGYAFLDV